MDFVQMVDHVCCYPTEIVSYIGESYFLDLDTVLCHQVFKSECADSNRLPISLSVLWVWHPSIPLMTALLSGSKIGQFILGSNQTFIHFQQLPVINQTGRVSGFCRNRTQTDYLMHASPYQCAFKVEQWKPSSIICQHGGPVLADALYDYDEHFQNF